MADDRLRAAYAKRRAVLGDAYVDRALAGLDDAGAAFQDQITGQAWGVWAREGPLSVRDRSLLVLAMTAALGRMEEFEIHARTQPRTGVTDEELDELVLQVAAYAGAPAGVSARRILLALRAERAAADDQA
jgi:4-carboxymuconolactone decarboxylase